MVGCLGRSKKQESKKKLWGLPFPSPKIVQTELFYIILLTVKVGVTLFQFGDDSPCTETP